jgi:hypothetical protein
MFPRNLVYATFCGILLLVVIVVYTRRDETVPGRGTPPRVPSSLRLHYSGCGAEDLSSEELHRDRQHTTKKSLAKDTASPKLLKQHQGSYRLLGENETDVDQYSLLFVFLMYSQEKSNLLSQNVQRIIDQAPKARHLNVSIHIILDGFGSVDPVLLKKIHDRAMKVVPSRLTLRDEHLGMRQSWLNAIPANDFDFVAIIEDGVLLSRFVIPFSQMCIKKVLTQDSRMVGCSYYGSHYSDITNEWSPGFAKPNKYYAWQMPQRFGALYSGNRWNDFLSFAKRVPEPGNTPAALSNRWPFNATWTKLFLRFMYSEGTALLYPPTAPGSVSIPTSLTPSSAIDGEKGYRMEGRLMTSHPHTPRVGHYEYFSLHGHKLEAKDPQRSDFCSLVYAICKEVSSLRFFLQKASRIPNVGEIVLLVQPCKETSDLEQRIKISSFPKLKVHKLKEYDRSARFELEDLKYECAVHAEEDSSDVPATTALSIDFFRMGYFDRLIGTSASSAVARQEASGKWIYTPDIHFKSILSDSHGGWSVASIHGLLVPIALTALYLKPRYRCHRSLVRRMKACEGLLINSVAYLETGKSPVWIAGGSAYTSTDLSGSLEAQNTCLNEFVATLEFNIHDMPPACMVFVEGNSREIFPQDSLYGTFRDRIIMTEFSEQIPHPFPYIYNMTGYNRTRHRIDGYCGLRKPTKTHAHLNAHVESEEDKTKFLTYIPVFDHSKQLRALQNGIQIAKAWNMMLLLPRFYDFSKGQFDMGLATSSPSVKYSDIYDIKHLKKYHHLIGEVDDYSGVGLDYIFNVSLKSSGPYILSPLEFYADVGLLIPRTRLLQMDKLIQLSDIKTR